MKNKSKQMEEFTLILTVAGSILLFFIMREVACWYFKINKQIKIQQAILETMLKTFEKNGGEVNWDTVNEIIGKK